MYPRFGKDDAEFEEDEILYKGFFQMRRASFRHRLFKGGWTNWVQREYLERGTASALLPYDPCSDRVVLCEQFRVGARTREDSPWLLELVAGIDEPDESSREVVLREAEEEAGLQVLALEPICSYLPSAGGSTESVRLWLGLTRAPEEGSVFGLDSEDEDIQTHVLSREQAQVLASQDKLGNAAAIIAIQWLQINAPLQRQRWVGMLKAAESGR